jgi:hypothetical protein
VTASGPDTGPGDWSPPDPLLGYLGFVRVLRAAGIPADASRGRGFLAAMAALDVADREQTYWAGRLTLCAQPDDLPRFDAAFAAWYAGREVATKAAPTKAVRPAAAAPLSAAPPGDGEESEDAETLSTAASDAEVLRQKDFSELSVTDREEMAGLLARLRYRPATRRALRRSPARRGTADPRATIRRMLHAGGEVVRPAHHRRDRRPRRLVLLIDVSGSMSPYADALLRTAHVLTRCAPASVETFTVGTRLTRLTRAMRHPDIDVAMRAVAATVPDYAGGTRLGETLKIFIDRWGQRGLARGAVVVLFSDGWERGGPELLGQQARRLSRLARALVWANPHSGRAGYAPVQSGIVAALPAIDTLVSGHSLAALEELMDVIARA